MWATACAGGRPAAQERFERANQQFLDGNLKQSASEAERGYSESFHSNPELAFQFKILEAKAALWRGLYSDVLKILEPVPSSVEHPDLAIPKFTLLGVVDVNTHNFRQAEQLLTDAAKLCETSKDTSCGYVLLARGLLASEQAQSVSAEQLYGSSLSFARSHGDRFLEADSLLNLGAESLAQGHFDEAIDRSEAGYEDAKASGFKILELVTRGNLGWSSYRLGDSERALALSQESEKAAEELADVYDQENELTNIGYIYVDRRQFDLAAQSFQKALKLAEDIGAKQDVYNVLRVLAKLGLQTGDLTGALRDAGRALEIARASSIHSDELYPMLVEGQVAARRGDAGNAQQIFEVIEDDSSCPVFLKWETQHSLAQLYEAQNQPNKANGEYRAALATFEAVRATVQHKDFQLSFLANAAHIYDDYVHFLVANGKNREALRWADFNRARTLSEGLGLLPQDRPGRTDNRSAVAPDLNPQAIARRANGTLLFYWLGEKQSYLWAADSTTTHLFTLPPRSEIEAAVQHYRSALNGPQNVLESGGEDGRTLYKILIAPAESMVHPNGRIFIFPDGTLNNLNFETLIVPSPKPHYWIEDADVINASSLRILAASRAPAKNHANSLLLIGDSLAVGKDYPELPKASDQMASVAKHFSADHRRIFSREHANPAAYLQNNPEQYSNIHFVAHGTASRLSPLDSAIVLSGDADNPTSFKLYARDIVHHHLKADLVTISACYGAGERQYSGEGLVGLAWAFLYAGSHNVIAALWDVADAPTYQLIDRFYDELTKGASPDVALRTAKLSLLQGTSFRNPFYWAPFQLYAA